MQLSRFLITFAILAVSPTLRGDQLEGRVKQVLSGDALLLKATDKTVHILRLSGINAPVKGQPFHDSSLASLYKLTRKKKIAFEWDKFDDRCVKEKTPAKKCEKVGRVLVDGVDINLQQVKRGFAWHNVRRLEEQSTPDRTLYAEAELEARKKRRGLWKSKNPVPPWKFRPPEVAEKP